MDNGPLLVAGYWLRLLILLFHFSQPEGRVGFHLSPYFAIMPKTKTVYVCTSCGTQSPKWMGRCVACGAWNTYVEEVLEKEGARPFDWKTNGGGKGSSRPRTLSEIEGQGAPRLVTPDLEFNRVLGGGLVPGSLVLIGGEPGIGKSTLLLQVALEMKNVKVLYVSGEESEQQVKLRATRLRRNSPDCFILTETHTQNIFTHASQLKPDVLVVDSIQTLYSDLNDATPGSITQVRECAGELQRYAKETGVTVIMIGHITKDGAIAGPKLLEHMVDTVLQFEGDRNYNYRILRTAKNRFGPASELGIYEMTSDGLRGVSNPSELLISERTEPASGVAIAATVEGLRPMLIEVQALVSRSAYGMPQRTTTGFDTRRLHILLAVLEKRGGFKFGTQDVFLNIAGGIYVDDPAIDLAIVCGLLSSYDDKPIVKGICFAAEVGLSGEVRGVNRIEQRIAEAERLGFEKIVISHHNRKGLKKSAIQIQTVTKVEEVYQMLF